MIEEEITLAKPNLNIVDLNSVDTSVDNVGENVKNLQYPCLCDSLKWALFLGKITGLMPLRCKRAKPHLDGCKFEISNIWLIHSCGLIFIYVPYFFFMYAERLICGPLNQEANQLDWYLSTFGYMLSDLESISSLLSTAIMIKSSAYYFDFLSSMKNQLDNSRKLQLRVSNMIKVAMLFATFVFTSNVYMAIRKLFEENDVYNLCLLTDMSYAIIIRGITLIFPTVETILIFAVAEFIVLKFNYLSKTIIEVMEKPREDGSIPLLHEMAALHRDIYKASSGLNAVFGIPILMGVTSSLYLTVYYIYRLCLVTNIEDGGNSYDTLHFVLTFIYRLCKFLILVVTGYRITSSSIKPLETLQNSSLANLKNQTVQEIQTLILLWQGKVAKLSGLDIVNIGPWILAPIIGNAITYLLIASAIKNDIAINGTVNNTWI